jgi:CRISPR-associated protein (TIGR02584 family)
MKQTVLLAVTGMSPAILTQTIWALSCNRPRTIPDRVVVITTAAGKEALAKELLTVRDNVGGETLWNALRKAVLGRKAFSTPKLLLEEICVVSLPDAQSGRSCPLEDIRTARENQAVADYVLETVLRFTENPEVEIVASLAGGWKTLGALLYACLSMLGRPGDRITHVLLSPEYEGPLEPKFYFPGQPIQELWTPDGAILLAKNAGVELADVPFVCLRNLFPREFGQFPGSFMSLVHLYQSRIGMEQPNVSVELDQEHSVLRVGKDSIPLTFMEHAFLCFLAQRAQEGEPPLHGQKSVANQFQGFLDNWAKIHPELDQARGGDAWRKNLDTDDIKKLLSRIRKKVQSSGHADVAQFLFPLRGPVGFRKPIRFRPKATVSVKQEEG